MAMSYDELKNLALNKYGHIDSIPDSTYNALRAYKDNGASALDDDNTYNILRGLKESTPVDEGTTVQGGVVFMHPTTPEKAKAYADREIGISDVPAITKDAIVDYFNKFKSGPFNEESAPALALAAEHPGTVATGAYGTVRKVLSYPASVIPNLWARANEEEVDAAGKQTNKGEGYWAGYARKYPETVAEAQRGEGVAGVLADPANLSFLIPGLAEYAGAGKLGEGLASAVSKYPISSRALGSAIEGVGYTAASEALDPTKKFMATDATSSAGSNLLHYGLAGGLAGTLGAGGAYMRNAGKESFPGIMSRTSAAITPDARRTLEANLDDIMSRGIIPKNRAGYRIMSDDETAKLGREYDKGIEAATPTSFDYPEHGMSPTGMYHRYNIVENPGVLEGKLPLLTPLSDIKQAVTSAYRKKLGEGDIISNKNIKRLNESFETARASAAERQKLEQYVDDMKADLAVDPSSSDANELELLDKILENPVYEARDLSNLRNNRMDPSMYKNIDKGEGGKAKRHLSVSYRDVINDILESDARYAAAVSPEVKANYALYKSLGAVVDKPGAIGLANRLPWGQSVDPWRSASLKYNFGRLLERARKLTPTISDVGYDIYDTIDASQADTTSGY